MYRAIVAEILEHVLHDIFMSTDNLMYQALKDRDSALVNSFLAAAGEVVEISLLNMLFLYDRAKRSRRC